MKVKFSYYKAPITNKIPFKDITLEDLYKAIGGDYFKVITLRVRAADKMEYKSKSGQTTSMYKEMKKTLLPYVTFGGTFNTRKNESIKSISGLMCFDFDHIGDPEALKERLSPDDNILMMFTSPAGDGLKVVYEDPMEEEDYSSQYEIIRAYFLNKYNLKGDPTQDISRACFVCHDPKVWFREINETTAPEYDLAGNLIDPVLGYPITWKMPTPLERMAAKYPNIKTLIERLQLEAI